MCLLLCVLVLSGCETVGYYSQAVQGQWQVMRQRVPVAEMVAAADTAPELQARLRLSQNILEFAEANIGLSAEGRYRHYVDLKRDYVVWNVVAAPQYSLVPQEWCYPVVGCAPYRGYFKKATAEHKARSLDQMGMDTYVGGVPAYSTLGWFDDPLLSSFVQWPEADFVQLLLHELAHSKLWVSGDVAFNESFAEFVGLTATKHWYQLQDRQQAWQEYAHKRQQWSDFKAFLLQARDFLARVYASADSHEQASSSGASQIPASAPDPAQTRQQAFDAIQGCYQRHLAQLGHGRFDPLMASLNNAYLASLSTYADWVPGFAAVFSKVNGNWAQFFVQVDELASLDQVRRDDKLAELTRQQKVSHQADGDHAEQVQCKTFRHHTFDLNATG